MQAVAFVAKTFDFFDFKARILQGPADMACGGIGGKCAAGSGPGKDAGHKGRRPHLRIFRRGKAVKIPGICLTAPAGQQAVDIARRKGKCDICDLEPVPAGTRRPVLHQCCGQGGNKGCKFRPGGKGAGHVFKQKGAAFKGRIAQPCGGSGVVFPAVEGLEKIEPHAKAKLGNGKLFHVLPALWQAIAPKKDGPRFPAAILPAEIAVMKLPGDRIVWLWPVRPVV